MANQATAKNGEEYEIDSQNRVLFERIKQQKEGLSAKKQAADLTGITDQEILSGKNDNIVDLLEFKAKKLVNSKIDSISEKLTSDPERQKMVRETIEKVVQERELATESETVNSISKAAAEGDIEKVTTDEIAAKEALRELEKAEKENPEAFRQYRITNYIDTSLKQARIENKNLTPEQEQLLREQAGEIAGVMYSNGNIGNQGMMVSATFNDQSRGKVQNEFGNLKGLVGFMTSNKKPSKIIEDSDKREAKLKLGGVKIPTNYEKDAFDRAKSLLKKDTRSLRQFNSIQGGGSFLVRIKMTFYNFASGWKRGGGLIQTEGGYLSGIGRQSANEFVPGAMGLLLQNGGSGIGEIAKGVLGSGVKNLAGDAALKLAGGALGPAGLAASKALGFLKKFFGNTGSKLGIGARKGFGSVFDNGGSMLGKAAMGLGALLGSIGFAGTATASTLVSGAVVGGTVGYAVYNEYSTGAMVSGLVVDKKDCESRMDWVYTGNRPGIPCEDMSKYTKEMRTKILEAGYQTRCAVAAAVQYLIYDFPYFIPYDGGGRGQEDMGIGDDWCDNDSGGAMDCIGLVRWAYRQGGFAIKKSTSTYYWEGGAVITNSWYKTVRPGTYFKTDTISFTENNCAEIKERIQPGDIVRHNRVSEDGWMHAGIVIGVDGTKIHVAQEGNGVNSCFINICTGNSEGLDHGCGEFDRVSLMDNFFNYYVEGTAIDGYPIKPNSDTIYDFKNSLEK